MDTVDSTDGNAIELWKNTRSGAWAGRGFNFQHLITTLILLRQWAGQIPSGFVVPEGLEDCVVELCDCDIWIQIKSRETGKFSDTEIQQYLNDVDAKTSGSKQKKPIQPLVILECAKSSEKDNGICGLFAESPESFAHCSSPGDESVDLLSKTLKTAPIISDGIVSDLYRFVARISLENATRPYDQRRRISTSEIERRIFERLEAEDSSAIDAALLSGALEPVDFSVSIDESGFYLGVKVRPGHIKSELVLDRPDDREKIIYALAKRRQVLVSGPSGAGKSALMWLSASALAGQFRWYQISGGATVSDANEIVRFIRSRIPSKISPIGLAFDEIGSNNGDLWNHLANELRGLPDVYLLGSVRQEDIEIITNRSDVEFININLNERLAEALWEKLQADRETDWKHWREPFEQSDGLMLEYVHLLTQGKRLNSVIEDQVRQRERENRQDELAIIRSTSVLYAYDGEVEFGKLAELLSIKPEHAALSLKRLIDEHLVKESRPGVLGGLHMLRSAALKTASHDETVFLTNDTLWKALPALTIDTYPRVVQAVLADAAGELETTTLQRLAEILGNSDDIDVWVAVLTGLGLATLERSATTFISQLESNGIERAHWSLASMFAVAEVDTPDFPELEGWSKLHEAILTFRDLPTHDLRLTCLELIPEGTSLPPCRSLSRANKLLSCLVPILGGQAIQLAVTPEFEGKGEQDIHEVAAVLSTAYLVSPEIAENLVQAFGGEQILFDWFSAQSPWSTKPIVKLDDTHGRTVRSDRYYITDNEEIDIHETVCDICETLIALSPASNAAASDAIDPMGGPIIVENLRPWSKNMPRKNIPGKARIAWNIAFQQILLARSNSNSLTDYSHQMDELVVRTEKVFRSITEKWIKGKSIPNAELIATEVSEIINAVNSLRHVTPEKPSSIMTKPAKDAGKEDDLGALLVGVLGNLLTRLSKIFEDGGIKALATFAGGLASDANGYLHSDIWRALPHPPRHHLKSLATRLGDLSCILHELAYDHDQTSIQRITKAARKSNIGKAIQTSARYCRNTANQRFRKRLHLVESELGNIGWCAKCCSRPENKGDSPFWPAREVAILVELTDFEADGCYVDDCLTVGKNHFNDQWFFRIVPLLNGQVLSDMALRPSSVLPTPDPEFSSNWKGHIDAPFFSAKSLSIFDAAVNACIRVSSALACCNPKFLHHEEEEFISTAIETFEQNSVLFAELGERTKLDSLLLAHEHLRQIWGEVCKEFDHASAGKRAEEPLCMNSFDVLNGSINDQLSEFGAIRVLLLQDECMGKFEPSNPRHS